MQHIADAEAHAKILHAAQLEWAETGTNAKILQSARTRAVLRVAVQKLGATGDQVRVLNMFMNDTWSLEFEKIIQSEDGVVADYIEASYCFDQDIHTDEAGTEDLLWVICTTMWADVVIETDRWARANSGALTA